MDAEAAPAGAAGLPTAASMGIGMTGMAASSSAAQPARATAANQTAEELGNFMISGKDGRDHVLRQARVRDFSFPAADESCWQRRGNRFF